MIALRTVRLPVEALRVLRPVNSSCRSAPFTSGLMLQSASFTTEIPCGVEMTILSPCGV